MTTVLAPPVHLEPVALCAPPCGVALAYRGAGLVHVDMQAGCRTPDPVLCEHPHLVPTMARTDAHPCNRGHEHCCSCCQEED